MLQRATNSSLDMQEWQHLRIFHRSEIDHIGFMGVSKLDWLKQVADVTELGRVQKQRLSILLLDQDNELKPNSSVESIL